jgi:aspartyl-tRNA(Asn)/glutamyl-tRNA(Gln) amidotransferase subunit A
VVGIKPTHGLLPNWPAPADSGLIGDYGPMARTVTDAALVLDVLAGFDSRDPLSLRQGRPSYAAIAREAAAGSKPLRGMRIAFSPDLGEFPVDADVAAAIASAAMVLSEQGADIAGAAPELENPIGLYMPLYVADFLAAYGDQLEQLRDELPSDAVAEIDEFAPRRVEDYVTQLRHLWLHRARLTEFFADYDLLLTPATATRAFPLRQPPVMIGGKKVPRSWPGFMPFQVPWNLGGQPTVTVPTPVSEGELPIGLLLIAPLGRDDRAIRAAAAFEAATAH